VGNAFPPPVARALGEAIRAALTHAEAPPADAETGPADAGHREAGPAES
jgi:hypothetical protein